MMQNSVCILKNSIRVKDLKKEKEKEKKRKRLTGP